MSKFVFYRIILSLKKMSVTNESISKPIEELDEIYESITEGKCVLVLGPNFYADTQGTHQARLLDFFTEKKVTYQHYYEEDGLFLFEQPFQRTKACRQIRQFYQTISPSEQLCKIVKIPFHFYLTVTPDKLLHQAFGESGYKAPQLAHYKKDTEPQSIKEPTKSNPLIYNTFGILDNKESIILTHDDLYNYFKYIFSRRSMPEKVRTTLHQAENIVFLGVPFRKWYMHLLLREFGAHENKEIIRYAADHQPTDDIRTFCDQQFKIHFIDHDITQFVNDLYDKFEQENALRDNSISPQDKRINEMKTLVGKDKIKAAIEMLKDYIADTPLENEVIKVEGRFNEYKEEKRNNLLNPTELSVKRENIVKAIIDLIDLAKDIR